MAALIYIIGVLLCQSIFVYVWDIEVTVDEVFTSFVIALLWPVYVAFFVTYGVLLVPVVIGKGLKALVKSL